jgi:plastocyanin
MSAAGKPPAAGSRSPRRHAVQKGVPLRPLRLSLVLAAAALLAPAPAAADNPRLVGSVGPGPTISLLGADGARVTSLAAGTYDLVVTDRSEEHNFHLSGPGVDVSTDVELTGTKTFTITVRDGAYTFVCDPHASTMRGSFRVGAGTTTPPAAAPKRLVGTVGPGFSISLRTATGALAKLVGAGTYRLTINDRSASHNFHLVGPGVNRKTAVAFRGTVTWTLRLRPGTYRFVCDPHASRMKGSFRVR